MFLANPGQERQLCPPPGSALLPSHMGVGRRFYKLAVAASVLLLAHVTVCAIQHREYLKAMQQPFTYPPVEIVLQCALVLVLGAWGVLGLQAPSASHYARAAHRHPRRSSGFLGAVGRAQRG